MFFASLTRIADLAERDFRSARVPRERWEAGDYVIGRVAQPPSRLTGVELAGGRMTELVEGDLVVGALGVRHATLEVVGSWEAVEEGGPMHCLTAAGLLGRVTSQSSLLPPMPLLAYQGHALRDGQKVTMSDFLPKVEEVRWELPTILIVGTSMSSGKTTTAKVVTRLLKSAGLRVTGAKLTGAGRYRDILAMSDSGADAIFDFVDVGLPSSYGSPEDYRPRLRRLLGLIAASRPDVVVAEAGASPLEPYNGDTVLAEIGARVSFILLCASDPYAVAGVMQGFDLRPDLVAGLATSTHAGVELCERLTGVPALNILNPARHEELAGLLSEALGRA
jgi:hypothetical protein